MIGKIAPTRTADGLTIDGEIVNLGSTPRDVPRLRRGAAGFGGKEVQFEIVDPPKARLQPGEVAHFETPFAAPGRRRDRGRGDVRSRRDYRREGTG